MPDIRIIENFDAPELDVYARLSEIQLLNRAEPAKGMFIAESEKVVTRALDAGYEPVSFLMETSQISREGKTLLERCSDVPVFVSDESVLKALTGFPMTRGILCAMRRRSLPSVEALCRDARRIAILENVVNPTNLGAIFRSAAALGVECVLLTCDCTDPLYRRAARVSMGTVFQVPWTFFDKHLSWPEDGLGLLKSMNFKLAAMALSDDSVSIADPVLKKQERLALLLGSEGPGLAPDTIAACDYTVKIPMAEQVDSLNVAAASAVAFWELRRR